jgi:demethylmenaquinone methyltransferase/2-methoxy-6-polyprenyl-1,4-benzoquinol methylase
MAGLAADHGGVEKDPARIAGMFDAIAGRYDLLNHLLSLGCDWYWRRRAVRALELRGSETVVDVCTGTADLARAAVRRRARAGRVVGIDFAPRMLEVGRAKLRRQHLDRVVHLVRGDAVRLPVRDASADAVTVAFGIRNVERPDAACREMARALKPGGRLAILEFGLPGPALLRVPYVWYFESVLPCVGRLVSRHRVAYSYLPASVGTFPSAERFTETLVTAGFTDVRSVPLTFGIVYLYTAVKP